MKISIIQPSRNNLKYLKWSYEAIRKNQGNHEVEICVADDFSNDGTWEWCLDTMHNDPMFRAIRNEGPTRLGHTILYDRLVNEVASFNICMIYHADMYLCPGAMDAIEKHIASKTIVSLTRIEPPLHPPGPEKVLFNAGIEPEEFDENAVLYKVGELSRLHSNDDGVTEGIFAPWAFMKADFQEIGGHDPLYAPQSKEDSDIFNRFQLNGVKFIQTWEGFVYHMTCRGSRFNPTLTTPGRNSSEWERQNIKSSKEFIRKWGHFPKHDEYMKPIIPPKYDIGLKLLNPNIQLLGALEPWFSVVHVDNIDNVAEHYIQSEQPNTSFDLQKRVHTLYGHDDNPSIYHDILVTIDGSRITNQDLQYIEMLAQIIEDTKEIGIFNIGNLTIEIISLIEYQNDLIKL